MEAAAWTFASFMPPPRVEDLYGAAGGARVGEPLAFSLEMDQLEREERAFAASVLALVHRSAPEPIGVKFHREHARPGELGGLRGQFPISGRGSSIGSGRGGPFPPSQFSVDESSTDSISIGLHERSDGGGYHHEDGEEEEAEEEGEEEEEDMDEGETDDDDAFTAEEDHEDDLDMDMDSFERAMEAAAPDSSGGADGSTPLDPSSRPQW